MRGREEPTHLQVDWRYVACRKSEQRGLMRATRDPRHVTCERCKRARPAEFGLETVEVDPLTAVAIRARSRSRRTR